MQNIISEFHSVHKEPGKHKEYHRIFTVDGERYFAKRLDSSFEWELFQVNGIVIENKVAVSSAKISASDRVIYETARFSGWGKE